MTTMEAIEKRVSQRAFLKKKIARNDEEKLRKLIDDCNKKSGLDMQLICGDPKPFASKIRTLGRFLNAENYIAMVGYDNDPFRREKIGWFGEYIVLEAQKMGISSCWVSATYNPAKCACLLGEDQILECVIVVGYPSDEDTGVSKALNKVMSVKNKFIDSDKSFEELFTTNHDRLPLWFLRGVEAASKAPSAMNRQPVFFEYYDGIATIGVHETEAGKMEIMLNL